MLQLRGKFLVFETEAVAFFGERLQVLAGGVEFRAEFPDLAAAGALLGLPLFGQRFEGLPGFSKFAGELLAFAGGGVAGFGEVGDFLLEAAMVAAEVFDERLRFLQFAGVLFAALPGGLQGLRQFLDVGGALLELRGKLVVVEVEALVLFGELLKPGLRLLEFPGLRLGVEFQRNFAAGGGFEFFGGAGELGRERLFFLLERFALRLLALPGGGVCRNQFRDAGLGLDVASGEDGGVLLGRFKLGLKVIERVAQFVALAGDRGDLLLGLVDLLGEEAGFAGEFFAFLVEFVDALLGLGELFPGALHGGQRGVALFLQGGGERLGLRQSGGGLVGFGPGGFRLGFELAAGFGEGGVEFVAGADGIAVVAV